MHFFNRSFLRAAALAAAALAFVPAPANAFRLTPIVQDFAPVGRDAVKNFEVTNTTPERIAVEIRMAQRAIETDGNEILTPEEEDFTVYPSQIVVEPGKSQTVQVRWLGDPEPKAELAYRIIAEQLPVELDAARQDVASVRLLVKYEGSVYIVPKGAEADIALTGVNRIDGTDGSSLLQVQLENRGNAHGIVREPTLTLTDSKGTSVTLAGEQVDGLDNVNVLAGGTRHVLFPWPDELQPGNIEGRLESEVDR